MPSRLRSRARNLGGARIRLGLTVAVFSAFAALAVACGGDGEPASPSGVTAATESPGGAVATASPAATASLLVRPSADSPPASTRTATPEQTPAVTPEPTPVRTPVAGCSQGPAAPPAIYYGFGLDPGEVVAAFNTRTGCEEIVCEQAEVNGDGFWVMRIAGDNVCGPQPGDTVIFAIGGEAVDHTESWISGGVPADVARGIVLR